MVDQPINEIDLETLMKSAGQSFSDAQKALVQGLDVPVNMMLSNAELELKVAVSSDVKGKMSIRPISSLDLTRGGIDPGLLSTIRISFVSSIGDIKAAQPPAAPSDVAEKGFKVPALTGLTLNQSITLLKSGGWPYEPHAAKSEEIAAAGKESLGRVLRQQPPAGQSTDTRTSVKFWVDLGNTPVKELEGIGDRYVSVLTKVGISTVGEFSLAPASQIAAALHVSEPRAQAFIDMAALTSGLAILGFKDQVVELIVKGVGIRSVEQLAAIDPGEFLNTSRTAISSGKVRVPRTFKLTAGEVENWIKAAKDISI